MCLFWIQRVTDSRWVGICEEIPFRLTPKTKPHIMAIAPFAYGLRITTTSNEQQHKADHKSGATMPCEQPGGCREGEVSFLFFLCPLACHPVSLPEPSVSLPPIHTHKGVVRAAWCSPEARSPAPWNARCPAHSHVPGGVVQQRNSGERGQHKRAALLESGTVFVNDAAATRGCGTSVKLCCFLGHAMHDGQARNASGHNKAVMWGLRVVALPGFVSWETSRTSGASKACGDNGYVRRTSSPHTDGTCVRTVLHYTAQCVFVLMYSYQLPTVLTLSESSSWKIHSHWCWESCSLS